MLKLLREHEVAAQFRHAAKGKSNVAIAVPYWGTGASKLLGLGNVRAGRLVCNLQSPACNPYEIEKILAYKAIKIRSHPRLHAKIYATAQSVTVGSSNASRHGLTIEGETFLGLVEANVMSDDPELIRAGLELFEQLWASDETQSITIGCTGLTAAKRAWENRPAFVPPVAVKSLLAACRAHPEAFGSYFVAAYDATISRDAKRILRRFREETLAEDETLQAAFRNAEGYQFPKAAPSGAWLIDLDCRSQKPKVWGFRQIQSPPTVFEIKGDTDLTIGLKRLPSAGGRTVKLSASDKAALIRVGSKLLSDDGINLVSLAKVVAIIDGKSK